LVTIPESPHRDFDDISGPDLVVPAYEVGRRLDHLDSTITSLTVRSDGVTKTLRGDEITARFEAPSFIESRLIRMRATETDGPVSCRH
ncbi:MAG: hypothetical protein OEW83_16195, partial [Acidimicrobiia bacterium]|nr:hypothetical protein [Acidimicrobiia bacterium]